MLLLMDKAAIIKLHESGESNRKIAKSLNGKCPIDVIDEIYGKDFHQKLNLKKLPLKEIDFRIRRK